MRNLLITLFFSIVSSKDAVVHRFHSFSHVQSVFRNVVHIFVKFPYKLSSKVNVYIIHDLEVIELTHFLLDA